MGLILRGLLAAGAAVAAAFVVVIVLAIVDIYLTGHSKPSFVHSPIGLPGSNASWGDAIMLASAGLALVIAWLAMKPAV